MSRLEIAVKYNNLNNVVREIEPKAFFRPSQITNGSDLLFLATWIEISNAYLCSWIPFTTGRNLFCCGEIQLLSVAFPTIFRIKYWYIVRIYMNMYVCMCVCTFACNSWYDFQIDYNVYIPIGNLNVTVFIFSIVLQRLERV